MLRSSLVCALVLSCYFVAAGPANGQESEFSASGFDTLRVESEDKLLVPNDKAEEVWRYLEQTYVLSQEKLKNLDPLFTAYQHDEQFTDTYFDTPTFQVLEGKHGVRHRRRTNLTVEDHDKSGRELIQIKVNSISQNALNRGEYKYPVEYPLRGKSLMGLVARAERGVLENRLESLGIEGESLQPILTVHDLRKRIYINRDNQPFMSISFDNASAYNLWARVEFVEIEPELNEIAYTEADPQTKQYMEGIAAKISDDILATFPDVSRDLNPKYNKAFAALESQIPFFRYMVNRRLNSLGLLLLSVCFGVMLTGMSVYSYVSGKNARTLLSRQRR
jgi:uncharacterized protein YjbK